MQSQVVGAGGDQAALSAPGQVQVELELDTALCKELGGQTVIAGLTLTSFQTGKHEVTESHSPYSAQTKPT